jgi:hypothetical protein
MQSGEEKMGVSWMLRNLSSVVQLHDQLASGLTYKGDQNLSYPTSINRNGSIGYANWYGASDPSLMGGKESHRVAR